MPMNVVVERYDPRWAELFRIESGSVAAVFAANLVSMHHIGSTAIPGIFAKPVIDLLIEVVELDEVEVRNAAMETLGYEALGEYGIPGRRYFRKDNHLGERTHHAHVFRAGSPQVERHLAFRDFLIAHPDWANQYSELKRNLAARHPQDINGYMEGKDDFIKNVDIRAAAWRAGPSDDTVTFGNA